MATDLNVWAWSNTPADNATADTQINWVEGQDPATVNNSARAMMSAVKRWSNTLTGNVIVAGTGNAIQITTSQTISAGHVTYGFRVCFIAFASNTGATTVAIDGLSAVSIKRPNGDNLSSGDIVAGGIYDIAFDGTNYKLLAATGAAGTYGVLAGDNTWGGTNIFQHTTYIGNNLADVVLIKGQTVSGFSATALAGTSASAWHGNLGLGTAAQFNVATSGAAVPALNAANTWSQTQTSTPSGDLYGWIFNRPTSYTTSALYINNTGAEDGSWKIQAYFLNNGTPIGSIQSSLTGGAGATAYVTSSDDRLKRASTPIVDSGPVIDQLQPIRYRWGRDDGPEDFGFSAQALHAVVPQAVVPGKGKPGDKDFVPWMIEHGRLEAILVAEIKALRARVAALEAAA